MGGQVLPVCQSINRLSNNDKSFICCYKLSIQIPPLLKFCFNKWDTGVIYIYTGGGKNRGTGEKGEERGSGDRVHQAVCIALITNYFEL